MPPGRVLDIGCGTGGLSAALIAGGREVTSQDPSERLLDLCRAHLRRRGLDPSRVRPGGVDEVPERSHFDAVTALDVIEHIDDDVAALTSVREALRPGGLAVISVPAISRLYGPKDVAVGHRRRYDRSDLLGVIARAGLGLETCRHWNLVGVAPVWLSVRRGKRLGEGFRYSSSWPSRALNGALRAWFRWVEEPIHPPIGLTLLASARRPERTAAALNRGGRP